MVRRAVRSKSGKTAKAYDHKEQEAVLRPDIGIQAQFVAGEHKQIAVKVIDDRPNELLLVKKLSSAEDA